MIVAPYELVRYNCLVFRCALDSLFREEAQLAGGAMKHQESIAAFKKGKGRSWHAEKSEVLVSL